MKTKISIILQSVLIMLAVGWLASVQACADLTIFGRMTTDLSNATIDGKPITSRQQSQIGKIPVFANPFDTTLYQSGTKLKIVSQVSTCIRYIDEKKLIVLLPATKRYMTATLSSYASGPLFKDAQTTVVDMNKTKSILGHKAHLYTVRLANPNMTMEGYAWIGLGLAGPPSPASSGNPVIDQIMSKVTGIPLEVTGKWINLNSFGNLQFKYEVTALSTGPISPNEFYIPADFKEVRTSAYPTPLATN